jgi:hypothetical protein
MYLARLTQTFSSVAPGTAYGLFIDSINYGSVKYSIWTDNGLLRFGNSSSDECYVLGARNAGSTTTSALYINTTTGQLGLNSSSIKVKENVVDMGDTSWLYDLRPTKFNFKESGEASYGMIAEEVLEVAPDLVYLRPDDTLEEVADDYEPEVWERIEEGEDGKKYAREVAGIHYDRIIPVLVNELKKLKATVDSLQAAMA